MAKHTWLMTSMDLKGGDGSTSKRKTQRHVQCRDVIQNPFICTQHQNNWVES